MTDRKEKPEPIVCGHECLKIGGISATRIILWLVAITIVSFIIGFGILALSGGFSPAKDQPFSPFRHTAFHSANTTPVPLDGAVSGDIRLTLGAGELNVQGGAPDNTLMEAIVFSKAPEWQPELVQSINNSRKSVVMTEKGYKGKEWFAVDSPNSWTVSLNDRVPVRLDVNVGAGECELDLGSLNLESLTVNTGAGDTIIDLGNYHGNRFDSSIRTGVGDLTLRIPKESNTRIRAEIGIGDISNKGFEQDGDTFITPGFDPAVAVNEITLNQGVGSTSLELL
jgi:hypothetical protein